MGAVNPPQQSTGREQSAVASSQPFQQSRSHLINYGNIPVNECLHGGLSGKVMYVRMCMCEVGVHV